MKKEKKTQKRLTKRQRNAVIKYITEHPEKSYYSIAQRYDLSVSYVSCLARDKVGISKRKEMPFIQEKKWTGEVIDKYLIDNGSTIRRLTQKFRDCKSRITWGCTLCNNEWISSFDAIHLRIKEGRCNKGCPNCGWNEDTIYHDFLNELTHQSAYFLGVFRARGRIEKLGGVRSEKIIISSDTKEKMNKIKELVSSNCKVRKCKDSESVEIVIYSPKMIQKLKEYKAIINGKKPNSIPKIIADNKEFFPDYLRGYIDCVGYVEIVNSPSNKNNLPFARVNMPASKSFAQEIQQFHKKGLKKKKAMGYVTECVRLGKKCAPEFHVTGNYAAYGFLKLVYNSSVSPIKYMSHKNYNKFLRLQDMLTQRAERNKKVVELAKQYKEIKKEIDKRTLEKVAKKYKLSMGVVKRIEDKKPLKYKKPSKETIKAVREERGRAVRLKQEARMIVHEATSLTGMGATTFTSIVKNWKKIKKYNENISEFEPFMINEL